MSLCIPAGCILLGLGISVICGSSEQRYSELRDKLGCRYVATA